MVYTKISANDFYVFAVNEAFTHDASKNAEQWDATPGTIFNHPEATQTLIKLNQAAVLNDTTLLERLDNADCIRQYAQDYVSIRSNLLMIVPESVNRDNASRVLDFNFQDNTKMDKRGYGECPPDVSDWVCGASSDEEYTDECQAPCRDRLNNILKDAADWKPYNRTTGAYCLSQLTPEHCVLSYNLGLAVVVMFFTFIKLAIMLYVMLKSSDEPLLTVGDAIASFISDPDATTRGQCLLGPASIKKVHDRRFIGRQKRGPQQWTDEHLRWWRGASVSRWSGFAIL